MLSIKEVKLDHMPSIAEVCKIFGKDKAEGFQLFFIGYSGHELEVVTLSPKTENIFLQIMNTKAAEFCPLIFSNYKKDSVQTLRWRCGTAIENRLKNEYSKFYPYPYPDSKLPDDKLICSKPGIINYSGNKILIIGCGNSPTILGYDYMQEHSHEYCDTIDIESMMNPTFLMDIKTDKIPCPDGAYDEIIAEGIFFEIDVELYGMAVELKRCIAPNGQIFFPFSRKGSFRNDCGHWTHPDGEPVQISFDEGFKWICAELYKSSCTTSIN
jgi:hypothetical protein